MKLLEIINSINTFAGLKSDEKGFVSNMFGEPVFIENWRLVTPTTYQLRESMDPERIILHPLSENVAGGEPKVIKKLLRLINIRLNMTTNFVAQGLLSLAVSPTLHKDLNIQQLEMMKVIKATDKNTSVKFAVAGVAAMKESPDAAYVNIYLNRGGMYKSKKFARLGVVNFPWYSKLKEDKLDKIRVMDKEPFTQVMEFIFPGINETDSYNAGSDSSYAPFCQAMLMTASELAQRLNNLIDLYDKYMPWSEDNTRERLYFDMSWLESISVLDTLGSEVATVPRQNDGPVATAARVPENKQPNPVPATVAPLAPVYATAAPQHLAPTVAQTVGSKAPIDLKTMMAAINSNQPQQVQPQQQMMMPQGLPPGVFMTPQGPMIQTPQGMMPFQPQMMQMPQMTPNNGYPNPYMQPQAQGMMMPAGYGQPQQRTPTWAQLQPNEVMVTTPNGPMTQAMAMQLNLPWNPIQQAQQFQGNGMPGWAQGR